MSYAAAAANCAKMGGALASLNTLDKITYVTNGTNGMLPKGEAIYVGAECRECEEVTDDKWRWLTDDPLSIKHPMWRKCSGIQAPWDSVSG